MLFRLSAATCLFVHGGCLWGSGEAITGRVVEIETGRPLADMTVLAMRWREFPGGRTLLPHGNSYTTSADGNYELSDLSPGEYRLLTRPQPEGRMRSPAATGQPPLEFGSVYYSKAVVLKEGERLSGADFNLKRRRVAAMRGRLTGAPGEVEVVLNRLDLSPGWKQFSYEATGRVKTGETFEITNIEEGRYVLTAATSDTAAVLYFNIENALIENVDVQLRKGLNVEGVVRWEGNTGSRLLATLSPVERSTMSGEPRVSEVTWPDGRFRMDGVWADRYRLLVSGLPAGTAVAAVQYNGAPAPHGVLKLDRLAPVHQVEVAVRPAGGTLQVSTDPGTLVCVLSEPADAVALEFSRRVDTADSVGLVTLRGLLPGDYRVVATRPGTPWMTSPEREQFLQRGMRVKVTGAGLQTCKVRSQ